MQKRSICYFAGATASAGFTSYFDELYDAKEGFKVYILKGGPGTGKSTLMKKIASRLDGADIPYELFYCSSDPDSLDAIRIPSLKTVVLDGTSPHTLDPVFPGACEVIVNLGECFNKKSLFSNREKIIDLSLSCKKMHKEARKYINAAGSLSEDSLSVGLISCDLEKAVHFGESRAKKYGFSKIEKPKETHLFLSAVTPKGIVSFEQTLENISDDVYVIEDNIGGASGIIISKIKTEMLKKGYEIISFMSPLISGKTEHIYIPEQKIAFCTQNQYFKGTPSPHRTVHASRFINKKILSEHKTRLNFNKKASIKLLENASVLLNKANALHRELEEYYINAMDYKKLDKVSQSLTEEIVC